jgi:hypothetical protein
VDPVFQHEDLRQDQSAAGPNKGNEHEIGRKPPAMFHKENVKHDLCTPVGQIQTAGGIQAPAPAAMPLRRLDMRH